MNMISPRLSQAHCQVAPANALPKPVKELVLPTQGLIEIKHETLTICISNSGKVLNFKVCKPHKLHRNLISL